MAPSPKQCWRYAEPNMRRSNASHCPSMPAERTLTVRVATFQHVIIWRHYKLPSCTRSAATKRARGQPRCFLTQKLPGTRKTHDRAIARVGRSVRTHLEKEDRKTNTTTCDGRDVLAGGVLRSKHVAIRSGCVWSGLE